MTAKGMKGEDVPVDPILTIDCAEMLMEPLMMAVVAPRILPMRHPGLFAFSEIIGALAVNFVFGIALHWLMPGFLALVFLEIVLPCLMWRGSVFRRVCAVFLMSVCLMLAQLASDMFWEALFGMPTPEDWSDELLVYQSNIPAWIGYELIFVAVSVGLLAVVKRMLRRWNTSEEEGSAPFVFLLVAELLLAAVVVVLMARSLGAEWVALCLVGAALALATGMAATVTSARLRAAREARRRAEELGRQREAYLGGYRAARAQIARVAHLRHDFRNETAAAARLARVGDIAAARGLLASLLARCEEADGAAEGEVPAWMR